ncbi:uncharacterized protein LOC132176587 isoform X2 [Corylus avellana]|uniref:uncharacterized protein LOC132176587 isoform X2 n=1 Tax=Corylus avellana TaxID=13451 RepID=UPI00286A5A1E|nr:uncharacterized protein LOC132176587 isoform X2 [Corylus avellana]
MEKKPPRSRSNSNELCDICGDVGFDKVLATCIICNTAREHTYCMRVYSNDNTKNWTCESCLSSNIVLPEACLKKGMMRTMTLDSSEIGCRDGMHTAGPSSGGQAYSKRQKPAETGKVKFITAKEAIKLSSAATKRGTPSQTNFGRKPGPSYSKASSQKTPVGSRTATPKCSTLRVKENPSLGPSGLMKPPRHGGAPSMINQRAPQALKKFKDPNSPAKVVETSKTNVERAANKASCAPSISKKCLPIVNTVKMALAAARKEDVCGKPLMNALIATKEVETSNTKMEKTTNEASHTPSLSRHSSPIVSKEKLALVALEEDVSGKQPMDSLIAKEHGTSTMKIEDDINKASCTFSPLMHTSQTVSSGGNFQDDAECKNSDVEERDLLNMLPKFKLYCDNLPALRITWKGGFLFTSTPGKFYGGFLAQPKCTINRKAYEISQRMPLVLQVKLLPRCQLWEELFQNNGPDLNDVALYFFPDDNIERSKETTACLFELMEAHNSMMSSFIGGAELLIFTSKQMHVDSQKYFCGVFRHVKDKRLFTK